MKHKFALAAVAAAALLAACGGGSQNTLLTGNVGNTCPPSGFLNPVMAFPAAGALNVSVNAGVLVLYSYSAASAVAVDIQITPNGGFPVDLGTMGPAPAVIPTPTGTPPSPAAANFGSVTLPVLQHALGYTVTAGPPKGTACATFPGGPIGTFATN